MRWQIVVAPRPEVPDSHGAVLRKKLLGLGQTGLASVRTARLYLLDGDLDHAAATVLASRLLSDPVAESFSIHAWDQYRGDAPGSVSVFKKVGVMDPAEAGILRGATSLGHPLLAAKTATRYELVGIPAALLHRVAEASLANPAIEEIQVGNDRFPVKSPSVRKQVGRKELPLARLSDAELEAISKTRGLSLTLLEMKAIQAHFAKLGRPPTEIELETLAQTWSEHCKHKTFTSAVRYHGPTVGGVEDGQVIPNLLKSTIKAATEALAKPFCLSVFHDNAGVIAWEGNQALCFKVETHNHPSAIEPYGGAGTGVGGVIRDILGTGLGARPIANTDVFCVAPPDLPAESIPRGALPPLRVLRGVVSGVRDYGNQMGIPTVNGAVVFDPRYVGNPLVYCGTVGLLPTDKIDKTVKPGDLIVALGGRTGRDGIHGATFSSAELHETSEADDAGAVQIGNAITEKKVLDIVLKARDQGLFRAITDCGAGGFSSAVGEMGAECGARVHLERAPLKYDGLTATEIWISESQERMVMAVPPAQWPALEKLAASEDVLACVLGEFTDTRRLELYFQGELLGDLGVEFLHEGVPRFIRDASWSAPAREAEAKLVADPEATLIRLLASPNIASKEWIVRQYDHEVQAGSVIKPLVGSRGQGPSDGAVLAPVLGSTVGVAITNGINPWLGDLDPYWMAFAAIDEALRNLVAVGGDPDHCAILDNFSWGNCAKPDRLGALVRASLGCRDAALAYGTPFISGKDSLNNEYKVGDTTIVIPPSLLISAIARVPDVRRALTMDLKSKHSRIYLVGHSTSELGGSSFLRLFGRRGNEFPKVSRELAPRLHRTLHQLVRGGHLLTCHDLSDGGLAVAAAEMVLASDIGMTVNLGPLLERGHLSPDAALFAESPTRWLIEVAESEAARVEAAFRGLPCLHLGSTQAEARLRILTSDQSAPLIDLEATTLEVAFREPLARHLEGLVTESTHG